MRQQVLANVKLKLFFWARKICPGPPPTMMGDEVCNGGGAGMIDFGADDPRQFDDVNPA